jgi:hypothetical protein
MKTLILGFALTLFALPAAAQTAGDSRWAPWVGCWELVTEDARDVSPASNTLADELPAQPSQAGTRPRTCVTASADGSASFQTSVGGQSTANQPVVPDGVDRAVTDAECGGTQRAEWSKDGLRLFARAELTCKGDQGPRRVSGIALLASNGTWVDIQTVQVALREALRVRRYRRVAGQVDSATPRIAAARLTLDDVKEASSKVSARALEAALVETNAGFDLRSSSLVDLDNAGVPDSVIDLMVALSYPERFVVERTASADRTQSPFIRDPFLFGSAFGYPMWFDDFGSYSPMYGYYSYSPYFYTPLGYAYRGGYDSRLLDGSSFVVGAVGASTAIQPSGAGRVVDGLGYTRVRPRETAPAVATGQSGATSSASGGSSSSSGGGAVSAQGYSSGSSGGGDSGRSAQPR